MLGTRLSLEKIEKSQEIQSWLAQFAEDEVLTAKSLLCGLQFISRDEYSKWLLAKLNDYSELESAAVYAVRKFRNNAKYLWTQCGKTQHRPAQTQGSEDLVSSIISNANRQHNDFFLDHPSLTDLKKQKIRHIILVDDSIGSGERVTSFLQLMFNVKKFLSWWSGGYIKLHILSYARTRQSETYIQARTPGSDYGKRKVRLSSKLKFDSDLVYDASDIHTRWGNSAQAILSLCSSMTQIAKDRRRGFGDVMGSIVFYHSVPNNIPGMLFSNRKGWKPLFPNRSLPEWTINLLENEEPLSENTQVGFGQLQVSSYMVDLLELIKSGLRTRSSLSRRLDIDELIVQKLIGQSIRCGFVSSSIRLSKTGREFLSQYRNDPVKRDYNYSLHTPQTWSDNQLRCAGQRTVQPSDHDNF